jgi:hypothetical protein
MAGGAATTAEPEAAAATADPEAAPTATPTPAKAIASRWSLATRVAFRFAFVFFGFFTLETFFELPWTDKVYALFERVVNAVVPWVGSHVLHLSSPVSMLMTGSGDRIVDHVEFFMVGALALIATVVWSILDRRRPHYVRLHQALRILVRFYLLDQMLFYGVGKLIPGQFPAPKGMDILETYANSSPMHLLWTFMGVSRPYQIFSGLMEVVGGALLAFRRTTTLGALLLCAVIGNVFALNLCYDVPVKLYSCFFLCCAILLLVPDVPTLFGQFFCGRPAALAAQPDLFHSRRARWIGRGVQILYLGWIAYGWVTFAVAFEHGGGGDNVAAGDAIPLAGMYQTESLTVDGARVDPSAANAWGLVQIWDKGGFAFMHPDGTYDYFGRGPFDPDAHTLSVRSPQTGGPRETYTLTFSEPDATHLVLQGTLAGHDVNVSLRKFDPPPAPLLTRGFHWISAVPYNQ